MHTPKKGVGSVPAWWLHEAGVPYMLAHSLAPPPLLSSCPTVFLKPSIHILLPPGLAPYFNHKSPWQTSKYISAQLLSPSNNMSVDTELFMSPVTEMAISIGFHQGGASVSPKSLEQPARLISKTSSGTSTGFSNYHISVLWAPAPAQDRSPAAWLCGLIEYKERN